MLNPTFLAQNAFKVLAKTGMLTTAVSTIANCLCAGGRGKSRRQSRKESYYAANSPAYKYGPYNAAAPTAASKVSVKGDEELTQM